MMSSDKVMGDWTSLFVELAQVAEEQHRHGDFPGWLLAEVMEISRHPQRHRDREALVRLLIEQIGDYDPYAGAGCFSSACGSEEIRQTLRRFSAVAVEEDR